MEKNFYEILTHFNLPLNPSPYGNGHINDTYIVHSQPDYILQRINKNVFTNPPAVMENIQGVTEFLRKKIVENGGDPDRETLNLICTTDGKPYYEDENGEFYRVFKFIDHAVSYDLVENPTQLYNAARAFGKFQNMLADYPAEKLHETIVDFHNTKARFGQFADAVANDAAGRAKDVQEEIKFVLDREADCSVVVDAIAEGRIPLRVTHNDTKLNNVMLDDKTGDGVCVIDLDTVMPGSLLYDYGDALRFGGSSGAEDEKDLDKIYFVVENFEAFTRGFLETLPSITEEEIKLLPFSIKLMTLECGSRFLADYLNGDVYFKVHREGHNLDRCRTQFKLVKDIEDKMDELNAIVAKIAAEVKNA
ncbi:MAG: aminoglycoside phosphotransferase family protein [Clostridia bacterium]|nr:aminoglycoside phosphotransferase family protein [Clostridia bacterium]MBQ8368585.1 aminoglycoside phosphotransferase family protein [Clostridia bacterium]MBQ8512116.1 aminoglycoside phosphotransferase family protein [Clostridia bacterium]